MARVSRVKPHLSEAEIKEKISTAKKFRQQQKWSIIYNAIVDPRPAAAIAKHTGTTVIPSCGQTRKIEESFREVQQIVSVVRNAD